MTLALYGKSRKRQGGLLLAALLAVLGATIGGLMLIGTAFAHNATITGTNACLNGDGTWRVHWTITNDINLTATISNQTLATTPTFGNLPAGNTSVSADSTAIPAATASVQLKADVFWSDGYGDGHNASYWSQHPKPALNPYVSSPVAKPTKYCDTGTIQVHKYIWDGKHWQNQGKGQDPTFTFRVRTGSENGPEALDGQAHGGQLDLIPSPKSEVWVTEDAQAGYTLSGFTVPAPGNSKCEFGDEFNGPFTSSAHIPAANWSGDNGTLHVCAYNKPLPPSGTIVIEKYVKVGGSWSQQDYSTNWVFPLDAANNANDSSMHNETKQVPADDYNVTETVPSGYALKDIYVAGRLGCFGLSHDTESSVSISSSDLYKNGSSKTVKLCVYNEQKPVPALSITKTADAASVTAGNPVGFTITITNSNATAASGVSLADTLPAGSPALTWVVDTTAGATTLTGCSITGGTALACTAQTIAGNTSKKVHVTANTSVAQQCAQQTLDNTAHYSYGGNTFDSNLASITINCAVVGAPSISKTKADSAFDGTKAYWTITINNTASAVALTGVVVTDTGAHLESTTPANACTGTDTTFTCAVAAQGTTVLKVSKPLGTYNQCRGTSIDNSQISAVIPGVTTPTPSYTSTLITIPGDDTACGVPTISKAADAADSTTTAAAYKIVIDNSTSEVARTVVITDAGVTWPSPLPTGCTAVPSHADQISCVVPSGGTTTIVVTVAVNKTCSGTEVTNTATATYLNDAGAPVTIPNTSASNVKSSSLPDTASCTKNVIFGKYVCNSYSDVQANEDAANASYNDIGAHVTDLIPVGANLGINDAVNPNNDGRIAANCHLEPWDFVLKDGNNTSVVTQNISLGSAALTPVTINAASMALALQPTRLRVEEVMKTGYGFAGIKCYTDHLHSDNWEWIDFSGGIPQGDVYCLAYNVKPPRTVEVCKVIDQNNDGIADDGTFKFDVRSTAPNGTTFAVVTLTATEGGEQACDTVTVPDNSQSSTIEVAEWTGQPIGWANAPGYPWNTIGGQQAPNGTANLGNTGNGTVTFHNKKAPATQNVTFIKVVCANFSDVPRNLEVAGIGWGTNDMPAGYDQNSLGAASPAGANDPVSPNDIPKDCVTVPGWNFDLKDSGGTFFRTVTTTGSIGPAVSASATITLTAAELQSALQPWHDANGYHGLYVSEQKQTGYGFAALKCYEDHKLLDNTDGINLTSAGTEGVYCIAYNVADPVTVGVAKSNNLDGSQVSAGASFNWTITVTVGGAPTVNPVHVSDSLPTGFSITNLSAPDFACVADLTTSVDCTLASGAAVGTHTITVTVTAPKPDANVCKPYTNTVNIGDLVFDERLLSQVALDIPRDQTYNPDTATNDVTVKDCTGTVIVKKIVESSSSVNPNDTSPAFTGLFDGSSWGNLQNNGTHTFNNVLAGGNHTITEALGTVNVPGDSLWHNDGFFAASEGVCPTGAAGLTPLTPSNITVVAGQTTTICVLNRRDQPNTLTATVFVYKVIASAFPSATDTFTGTVSSPNGGGNFSITTAAGASFPISLDSDHPDTTFSASEAAKAGYTTLGYKVLAGNAACPAPDGNYLSSVSSHAIGQASSTAYTVCIYNDPRVSITVHKTEQNGAATGAGQGWNVTLTGCGITPQQATTDASGNASFTNLPLCNAYFVSEDLNSKGIGAYLAASGFPTTVMVNATTAGSSYPVNFSNIHFIPPPLCLFGCSPLIITTPTVTPTSTPTPTLTTKPTEPTKTEKPEEPKKTPTTNIDIVGGEKTPGPGANATPLAPSTGSGLFGTGKSGSNLLLAVMGIFALSAGFAVIAVANKGKSRS